MDHELYISSIDEFEQLIPDINKFPKEQDVPDGMMECPSCIGFGHLVALAHTAPMTVKCPACNGEGVMDAGHTLRQKQGMDLMLIRKAYDIHILHAAATLQVSASYIEKIERGFISEFALGGYEDIKRTYLREFADIELPPLDTSTQKTAHKVSVDEQQTSNTTQDICWQKVYILGATTKDGELLLTTWMGDLPMVDVVLTGVDGSSIPFCDAPIPKGAMIHSIPSGKDPSEYAKEIDGIHAFGWYRESGFKRIIEE